MKTGWLSPTGEFVECDIYDHIFVARKLSGVDRRADDVLISRGWVKISMSLLGKKEQAIYWDLHHNLTPEQTRFLRPYFEENEFPVIWSAQYRWEHEVM